jgi:hypothetical protein
VLFEVDMQPLAPCGTTPLGGRLDQRGPHPVRTAASGHDRVQDERMDSTVPSYVDETDQTAAFPGADPAEAVPLKPSLPVRPLHRMVEPFGVQLVERFVVDVASPLIRDRHGPNVAITGLRLHDGRG